MAKVAETATRARVNIPTRHFRSLEGSTDALVAAIIPLQDYQHKTINLNFLGW